jgi:hypothetical protein
MKHEPKVWTRHRDRTLSALQEKAGRGVLTIKETEQLNELFAMRAFIRCNRRMKVKALKPFADEQDNRLPTKLENHY